jgi:hypothetical protein
VGADDESDVPVALEELAAGVGGGPLVEVEGRRQIDVRDLERGVDHVARDDRLLALGLDDDRDVSWRVPGRGVEADP